MRRDYLWLGVKTTNKKLIKIKHIWQMCIDIFYKCRFYSYVIAKKIEKHKTLREKFALLKGFSNFIKL